MIAGLVQVVPLVPIPSPSPLAVRYYQTGNLLWIVATLWGVAVPATIVFGGLSARLRNVSTRVGKRWYFTLAVYWILFTLLTFVANVPLDYYSGFVREHQYRLSSQTFGKWGRDEGIGLVLQLIGGCAVVWIPYALFRAAPKRWWLYTWIASVPIMLLLMFVEPIWIDPLFNHFRPLQDKVLSDQIFTLAHRAGLGNAHLYVVNKSVDTGKLNAYVTGIGSIKRIVLWDTIIKQLPTKELLMVLGHEMGHYVLNHVWKLLAVTLAALFVGAWLVHVITTWVLRHGSARLGFSDVADVASLPLLLLTINILGILGQPILLAYSRYQERVADRFGLEVTRDNQACAKTFVDLAQHNLAYPRPGFLHVLWRSSHPSLAERITFCNTYHPWQTARAPSVTPSRVASSVLPPRTSILPPAA